MHCVLVNHLGISLPRKSVVRLTDRLVKIIAVDLDVKPQNNNDKYSFVGIEELLHQNIVFK